MTKILVIEDEEPVRANIIEMLTAEEFDAIGAKDGVLGVREAIAHVPDLIVCDVMMPELNGYDVLKLLRSHPATASIPFIFLTAKAERADLRTGMNLGADDYLTKPFSRDELLTAIAARLTKRAILQKQETEAIDRVQEQLYHLVNYDSLTDLPNRLLLRERFEQVRTSLASGIANSTETLLPISILTLSLDRFHRINDAIGYRYSDLLLKTVAERLTVQLGNQQVVAHLNAHQFAIVLTTKTSETTRVNRLASHIQTVKWMARSLLDRLKQPFVFDIHELSIAGSIGIAIYPRDGRDIDTLIERADLARNHAVAQGGDRYQFYRSDMVSTSARAIALETHLRRAVENLNNPENQQFQLYYQPLINLATRQIVAAEALIRWHHPQWGLISPSDFIPLAEETNLIIPLGEWVLHTAARQTQCWNSRFSPPLRISVNLSGRQFQDPLLQEKLLYILQETGLDPHYLELEITETILVENIEETNQIMNELKPLGIRISIDDFGTGYSSLQYLQQFPFDTLKIDRCFIRNLTANPRDAAIAIAIIQIARRLDLEAIAEGVETEAELAVLQQHQCDCVQGYLFSPPVSACDFETLLTAKTNIRSLKQDTNEGGEGNGQVIK